jgi:uncharacterized protein
MITRGRRWLRGAIIGAILLLLSAGAFSWLLANTFIDSANHSVQMPADFPAAAVSIAGDGHVIAGSWRDLGGDSSIVLVLHGMRGDRVSTLPRARLVVEAGFSVLLIDLQAHGETPGDRITLGSLESRDVTAALAWIRLHAPGRRVGVIGVSLGGAAALLGDEALRVDALVLEAVHPGLKRAIENRVGRLMTPLLVLQIEPRLGVHLGQLDPVRRIASVGAPVLVVGGELDPFTTEEDTRELFAAAREPKELWIAPRAVHEDFARVDPAGYRQHVVEFLRRRLAPAH